MAEGGEQVKQIASGSPQIRLHPPRKAPVADAVVRPYFCKKRFSPWGPLAPFHFSAQGRLDLFSTAGGTCLFSTASRPQLQMMMTERINS